MRSNCKKIDNHFPVNGAHPQKHPFGKRTGNGFITLFILVTISGFAGLFVPDINAGVLPRLSHKHPIISVEIDYSIEAAGNAALRSGKQGGNCRTDDIIHLSITTGTRCYLMVFCIDSMLVPIPVLPQQTLAPVLTNGGKLSVTPFKLNEVTGTEIYYVVASDEEFSFAEITPFLDTTLSRLETTYAEGGQKGPLTPVVELRLPPKGKFSYDYIYFNHLPVTEAITPQSRSMQ